MTDIPARNSSGGLDCPRCGTTLVNGKSPFYLHNEYVGLFDSIVCEMCHYSLFTSARRYGLVGPEEEMIMEKIRTSERIEQSEFKFRFEDIYTSFSDDNEIHVANQPNSEVEVSSITQSGQIQGIRYSFNERHASKSTEVLLG